MHIVRQARLPVRHTKLHQRRIVTSALKNPSLKCSNTPSVKTSSQTPVLSKTKLSSNRLHPFNRHFATPSSTEYNMASDDASSHNNPDFQLGNVFNVKDKVALITGGGSGIGLMAVQALAVNGAKVYICGRTKEKIETVAKTYSQGISGQIIPITCDVSKKDEIAKLYDQISSKEKHLDILINNAGIQTKTFAWEAESADEMKKNLFDHQDVTFEDWNDFYRTNTSQIWFMGTAFLPLLHKASDEKHGWSGTIVNITSISGLVKTTQHHPAYNASKAAAIHVNRMLANEIQANGLKIRVNSIAPGVFPSEMTAGESGANQKSHIPKEDFETKVPAGRPGNDRDMASAVLFVATNQYLNGQTISVDGGYTLRTGL